VLGPDFVRLLSQAIWIICRKVSQLVTQVSGQAAEEKRHEEDARRFARGQVGQERIHEVSGAGIAEGGVIMHKICHFCRCFAVGSQEAIFEAVVAVGGVLIGAVENVSDGVESHGRKVGYYDVVAVNLSYDGTAAKDRFCLIKPKGGVIDIKSWQFNVFQSGGRSGRRWIEERRAQWSLAVCVTGGARRRRLKVLHSGGELCVVRIRKQRFLLHFE
jgi:hypothetical protein